MTYISRPDGSTRDNVVTSEASCGRQAQIAEQAVTAAQSSGELWEAAAHCREADWGEAACQLGLFPRPPLPRFLPFQSHSPQSVMDGWFGEGGGAPPFGSGVIASAGPPVQNTHRVGSLKCAHGHECRHVPSLPLPSGLSAFLTSIPKGLCLRLASTPLGLSPRHMCSVEGHRPRDTQETPENHLCIPDPAEMGPAGLWLLCGGEGKGRAVTTLYTSSLTVAQGYRGVCL
ncbi:unnamed protein product [Pleuronectes platessa]|uniref:Uncharacterized protein n=1 Tax=Pleuronectes platessa TaxID=8262 RepID=A0A9N7W0I3_PLEPL|nr:unnamed protein product [Pleuronectes platessa]